MAAKTVLGRVSKKMGPQSWANRKELNSGTRLEGLGSRLVPGASRQAHSPPSGALIFAWTESQWSQ